MHYECICACAYSLRVVNGIRLNCSCICLSDSLVRWEQHCACALSSYSSLFSFTDCLFASRCSSLHSEDVPPPEPLLQEIIILHSSAFASYDYLYCSFHSQYFAHLNVCKLVFYCLIYGVRYRQAPISMLFQCIQVVFACAICLAWMAQNVGPHCRNRHGTKLQ